MTDPIQNAINHSQALYLGGKAPETQAILNTLVDRAEELQAALENLLSVAHGITPTEVEFMEGRAVIDQVCWDDWDEVVKEAKEVLKP